MFQIAADAIQQRGEATIRTLEFEQCRKLRLPAGPAIVDDELTRDALGDPFTQIFGDQR